MNIKTCLLSVLSIAFYMLCLNSNLVYANNHETVTLALFSAEQDEQFSTTLITANLITANYPQNHFNYFADIALLKKIIPDEVFRSQVLPLIQTAFKNEPKNQITHEDWRVIENKILSLKASHNVDYPSLYLKYLEKKTLSDSMNTIIDKMGEDIDTLGEDLANEFHKFIDKNKGMFSPKKENKEKDTPSALNTRSM